MRPAYVLGKRQKPMLERCLHSEIAGSMVLIAFTADTLMRAYSVRALLKKALNKN